MGPLAELFAARIPEYSAPFSDLRRRVREVANTAPTLELRDRIHSSTGVQHYLLNRALDTKGDNPGSRVGVLVINMGDPLGYDNKPYTFGVYGVGMDISEDGHTYRGVMVRDYSKDQKMGPDFSVYFTTPQGWKPSGNEGNVYEKINVAFSQAVPLHDLGSPINVTPSGKRLPYTFY